MPILPPGLDLICKILYTTIVLNNYDVAINNTLVNVYAEVARLGEILVQQNVQLYSITLSYLVY